MMNLIRALIATTRPFSKRLSACELNGMLIGVFCGTVFSVLWLAGNVSGGVSYPLWLYLALALAAFCWFWLMGMLTMFLKYQAGPLLLPLAMNALLTSVLTIYICNVVGVPDIFFLLGLIVGYAVGRLLCRLCKRDNRFVREG